MFEQTVQRGLQSGPGLWIKAWRAAKLKKTRAIVCGALILSVFMLFGSPPAEASYTSASDNPTAASYPSAHNNPTAAHYTSAVYPSPPYPDKPKDIAITFTNDTLTEKSFTWVTSGTSNSHAFVVVWEADGGVQRLFSGSTETVTGRRDYYVAPTLFNSPDNVFRFKVNRVTVTGLKPNTGYRYICGDGAAENWSGEHYFDTAIESGGFSFIYMTDPQCAVNSQFELWKKCSERAYATFPDAKFIAIAGDLVDRGSSENLWDKFFYYGDTVLSNLTVVPAVGNHETDTGPHNFSKHFSFPQTSHGLPDYVYSFDFGNLHFMVLSTEKTYAQLTSKNESIRTEANGFLDAQINWMREEVSISQKKWNVVMLHKGIYSGGGYASSAETLFYRNKLAPVFDELSIDAVLQGHNHTFDRAYLYDGKSVSGVAAESLSAAKGRGTLYLTANSAGPKFYPQSNPKPTYLLKHSQPDTQLYTGVTVTDNYMKFDTYTVTDREDGSLFDTFTVYKQ